MAMVSHHPFQWESVSHLRKVMGQFHEFSFTLRLLEFAGGSVLRTMYETNWAESSPKTSVVHDTNYFCWCFSMGGRNENGWMRGQIWGQNWEIESLGCSQQNNRKWEHDKLHVAM